MCSSKQTWDSYTSELQANGHSSATQKACAHFDLGQTTQVNRGLQNYVSATVTVWLGYKTEAGEKRWFGSHDYSQELPSQYYPDLNLQGYVNSDQKPEQGLIVSDFAYRQVDVTADRAALMDKTHQRINRQTWKQAPQSYFALEDDPFGCRVRALYQAVNAQAVWVCESHETGFWTALEPAIAWLTKKGSDLSLQCRLLAGKHDGDIMGFTSAPENYDHSSRPTVAWLPYQDHGGNQYRQISLDAQSWLDQLGRNQSGSYSLYQAHEFEALKTHLQPLKESAHDTTD